MTEKPQSEQSLDSRLDEALELTFPASDPIAVHSPDPPPRLYGVPRSMKLANIPFSAVAMGLLFTLGHEQTIEARRPDTGSLE
jgi:hypothetical protein